MELLGKLRDRSVCASELLQNAAPGCVRESGERGVEAGTRMVNHMVQCLAHRFAACKGEIERAWRIPTTTSECHDRHRERAAPAHAQNRRQRFLVLRGVAVSGGGIAMLPSFMAQP